MAPKLCLVCGHRGRFRCSGCRAAYYCSRNHKKNHKIVHESTCRPYQMVWDDSTGYHLITSRDLEAGSFILHEAPLVTSLPFNEDFSTSCLGCSKELEKDVSPVSCPQCAWPSMCGEEKCWKDGSPHAMGECCLLKAPGAKVTTEILKKLDEMAFQLSIAVLRCIALKDREPRKWEKMMETGLKSIDLLSHNDDQHNRKSIEREAVVELVYNWMEGTNSEIPRDCIVKLCNMFYLLNSFRMKWNCGLEEFPKGLVGVYSVASRIGHSCLSNSSAVFEQDGQITVRAAVPIPKGSKILYAYECNPLHGTYQRNCVLLRMLGTTRFVGCFCERCKNSSELGCLVGGIYCPVCPEQQGILLPDVPEGICDMICNKCRTQQPLQLVIESILSPMKVDYDEVDGDIDRYESFICKYEKILHRHSHWMIRCKGALLQLYFWKYDLEPELQSDEVLRKRHDLALDLLSLVDIVAPGLNCWRGVVLFHLVVVTDFRISKQNQFLDEVIYRMLMETYNILSWEPRESREALYADKIANILIKRWKRDSSNVVSD